MRFRASCQPSCVVSSSSFPRCRGRFPAFVNVQGRRAFPRAARFRVAQPRGLIGSNGGVAPPSALRSVASSITSTTLRRQPSRLGEPVGVERVLAFGVAGPPERAVTRSGGPPSLGRLAHIPAHEAGGCNTAAQRCATRARHVQHVHAIWRPEYLGLIPGGPGAARSPGAGSAGRQVSKESPSSVVTARRDEIPHAHPL